jgi:hypothetical protein
MGSVGVGEGAALEIRLGCHWLQVIRIHTQTVAAQVIQTEWGRSVDELVKPAMSTVLFSIAPEISVTM